MTHHIAKSLVRSAPWLTKTVHCAARRRHSLPLISKSYNSSSTSKVLGRSSIFLQDGLDIRELPLVIRRMNAHEFPFSHVVYSGDELRPMTDEDKQFKQHLQDCNTLQDILKLLEIPGENVTAYSAAFALQRLCQLREGCGDGLDSFIKTAVFNELCDTATKDIKSLTTDILTTLVKCHVNSANSGDAFVRMVNEEVERRVGDGVLSMSELCALIRTLCVKVKGNGSLLSNMWIHLGNRFLDITHENISEVYTTLCGVTHDYRYLFKVVDKQLERSWWKLNAGEISAIARALRILNHENIPPLKAIGKWVSQNRHEFKNPALLRDLMMMYLHFSYTDANFIKALELFIPGNIARLDKTLVSMVMEYCRRRRYCSVKIFSAVATDFEASGHEYEPHEIVFCLRPFGQLNYVPDNATQLFSVVECILLERFTDIDAAAMVELLTSFSYIGRLPINFSNKVFSPSFMSRLQAAPDAVTRSRASLHLQLLRSALVLESPRSVTFVNWHTLGRVSTTITGRWHRFLTEVGQILVGLLGSNSIRRQFESLRHVAYFIDYERRMDRDGRSVKTPQLKGWSRKTLAVVTVMPEHCRVGKPDVLLGEYAMKLRHLALMGYTVIPVHYEQFMWGARTTEARERVLQDLLRDHITFTAASTRDES